jgi:hypothetical protein
VEYINNSSTERISLTFLNMKPYFVAIVSLCVLTECRTNSKLYNLAHLAGIYEQQDDKDNEIVLGRDSAFLYYAPEGGYNGESPYTDTIAYGKWSVEPRGWLAVSSPPYLSKKLKMNVEESTVGNLDTVYIKINSPVEDHYSEARLLPRSVAYGAAVLAHNDFLEQINLTNPSNVIKLYNPHRLPIVAIRIVAYPIPRYYDGYIDGPYNNGLIAIETETYGPKDLTSNHLNHFVIYIPSLTEEFLKFRRLNRDFIKIVNENELEWDGHLFTRMKTH